AKSVWIACCAEAVRAPAARWTMSERMPLRRFLNSGSLSLLYTVDTDTPAVRAAFSTVAPQARANRSAWSAFLRPLCAIAVPSPQNPTRANTAPETRHSGRHALGLLAGVVLEALDYHVGVQRVQLHQQPNPPGLLAGDQR